MTERFKIAEKLIAAFLIIWGLFLAYSVGYYLFYIFKSPYSTLNLYYRFSWAKTIKNFHIAVLLLLACIIGGVLLIINKKPAWAIAVICLLLNAILFFIPQYKTDKIFGPHTNTFWLNEGLLLIIWVASLYTLLLKPLRVKYGVNNRTYIIVGVITLLFVADKVSVYLTN
jgi:hypothetical protein